MTYFNIVLSGGIKRPEEMERSREMGVKEAVRTHITFIKQFPCLMWMGVVHGTPEHYNGILKDHLSQVTATNVIIVKNLKKCES